MFAHAFFSLPLAPFFWVLSAVFLSSPQLTERLEEAIKDGKKYEKMECCEQEEFPYFGTDIGTCRGIGCGL